MRVAKTLVRNYLRSRGRDVVPLCDSLAGHLSILLSDLAIDCVLDVGAHRGEYGAFLRALGYKRRIISFEPVLENFQLLELRAARDPHWTVRRVALGSTDGTALINVTKGTPFSSFLSPSAYGFSHSRGQSEIKRQEEVQVVSLDRALEELEVGELTLFLKTDTQGWDFEVLSGARNSLDRLKALQIEVAVKPIYEAATSYFDVIEFLNERGFELTGMFPVNRDDRFRVIEFDCIMIRETP